MKSVYTEQSGNATNCLQMVWNGNTLSSDLEDAFDTLQGELDRADMPLYVIVILNRQVNFPLHITATLALKAHKHANLKSWLVIGKDNMLARVIASVLSSVNRDDRIHWFNSLEEIHDYVESQNEKHLTNPQS